MDNTETDKSAAIDRIDQLINTFTSKKGLQRQEARLKLVEIGEDAADSLIQTLSESENKHVKWECAKALCDIKTPKAAPVLVEILMDEHPEIRWLGAEALISLGKKSLKPLLTSLLENHDSILLRQGAHHVLHALEREELLNPQLQSLLDVLRNIDSQGTVLTATQKALASID